MFLTGRGWCGRGGEQRASGLFLMVFGGMEYQLCEESLRLVAVKHRLRACVRRVSMSQMGHFMSGYAQLGKARVFVEGTYGDNGLPMSLDSLGSWSKWWSLVELPRELEEEFWKGGGHNSGGREMGSMERWANENLERLQRAGRG